MLTIVGALTQLSAWHKQLLLLLYFFVASMKLVQPLRDSVALITIFWSAGSTRSLRRCAMCSCVKSSSSRREDAVVVLLSEHVDHVGCTHTAQFMVS